MMCDRTLNALIERQFDTACNWPDEQRDGLLQAIHQRYGSGVQAVLIYGSYLRGKRDTLLDFYVLVEDYAAIRSCWQAALAWMLSPNVYQVCYDSPAGQVRAKYALMTLARFEFAMKHDFHSYFWARFAQPSGLLFCRDEPVRQRLIASVEQAATTFVGKVAACLPDRFDSSDLVGRGLSLSYQCELRSEPSGHAETLYGHNEAWYKAMLAALAENQLNFSPCDGEDLYENLASPRERFTARTGWKLRRLHGKVLSLLRLLKAVLTFDHGFDYLMWKISRHSGVSVNPTSRQSKYPLIFAWPLLWKLYRRGAFR
jgi:hypothetical protein